MTYKRSSRVAWTFSIPQICPNFRNSEFFNSHRRLHSLRVGLDLPGLPTRPSVPPERLRGLAHLLPHHTFGCLTLRDFRRVSTTDDGIREVLPPGRAAQAIDLASRGNTEGAPRFAHFYHHIFLVPPSQTRNRNRAIIPRQCNIENCARLQRRTQNPPQNHLRRLFDKYTISGQ